jgi:hypothetical protein
MNDPPSAFLAAAFISGIIEGSSVLGYHKNASHNNNNANTPSSINVASHSAFYGAVSLPLGIIGASPGVAFYPRHLKLSIDAQDNSNHTTQNQQDVSVGVEGPPRERSDLGELGETPTTPIVQQPVTGTGRGIGRLLREENLKKINQSNNSPHTEPSEPTTHITSSATRTRTSQPRLYRYISTLDGRPLPTLLSEAMRRSRCLFVGAALVSFGMNQYMSENKTPVQSNEMITKPIIDETGRINYNHDTELNTRLNSDMELALASTTASVHRDIKSYLKKAERLAVSTLCDAVELIKQRFGDSMIFPPLNWLFTWQGNTFAKIREEKNPCPIAIRLVLNEECTIPTTFLSHGTSQLPWITTVENENSNERKRSNTSLVLPIYCFGNHGLRSNNFKWWQSGPEQKSLHELPINATWLTNNQQQKKGLNTRSLIIEARTCPSFHQILDQKYSHKHGRPSAIDVGAFSRMLLNLARSKCENDTERITTSTIVLYDKDQVRKERSPSSRNYYVFIDALDALKWAVLSTIDNMSLDDTTSPDHTNNTQANASEINDNSPIKSTQVAKRSTQYASNKDMATAWTVVDVIGVSIRHLLESTYRFASAVTFWGQHTTPQPSSRVINIVSPCKSTVAWLGESIKSHGWTLSKSGDNSGDVTLILGRDDLETCNMVCSMIESRGSSKDQNVKLLVLLENPSMCEMLNAVKSQFPGMVILCAPFVYEFAFAIVRSCLVREMNSAEAQLELDKTFSCCSHERIVSLNNGTSILASFFDRFELTYK